MKTNQLPPSFSVLNDGSEDFKDIVIPYLGINNNWALTQSEGCYFGVTKNKYITISDYEDDFEVILTIQQFKDLIK